MDMSRRFRNRRNPEDSAEPQLMNWMTMKIDNPQLTELGQNRTESRED